MLHYKSQSDTRPVEWDKTSSESFVYHNYNVVEVEETDEQHPHHFDYDVDEYTNKEYIGIMDECVRENTDAIVELAEIIGG